MTTARLATLGAALVLTISGALAAAPGSARALPAGPSSSATMGRTLTVDARNFEKHLAHGDEEGTCIVVVTLPGRIEAENYRYGGEGVGYHDTSDGNNGGVYRFDDVDIRQSVGHFQVSSIEAGEWLAYDVDVQQSGLYTVTAHVSSGCCNFPKTFHIESDGVDVGDRVDFELLDSWDTLFDVTESVPLVAGTHALHRNGYRVVRG